MRHQYYLYFQLLLHVTPGTVLRNLASVKRHGASITSTNSLSYVQSRASLKDLPHPLLLYHLLAEEASSPPKYLNIESLHTCSQRVLLDLNAGINMLDSVIHTPGRCCLLYWHLALQLYHRQSLLPLHLSPKDRFLPHQYQRVFHIPMSIRKSYPASLTACQEENDVHIHI